MQPVVFRLSPAQRAANATYALVLFAILGLLRIVTMGLVFGLIVFGVGVLVAALNFGLGALWSLTLTPEGVTIKRYGTTVIPWAELQTVTERNWLGTRQLKFIRRQGGAKISLAPMTHWMVKDPEFEQKLATIRQWHVQFGGGYGAPGFPQQQPYGQQPYPGQQPYAQQPQQNYQQQPYAAPNPYAAQQPYGQPQQANPYAAQQIPNQPQYPSAQQPNQQRW